jgi:hypothetical protein
MAEASGVIELDDEEYCSLLREMRCEEDEERPGYLVSCILS